MKKKLEVDCINVFIHGAIIGIFAGIGIAWLIFKYKI